MSLDTWKAEYYPIPAEKATRTWKMAMEHSLRKWTGRREENLKKYNMKAKLWGVITDRRKNTFTFADNTCALCVKSGYEGNARACVKCALKQYLGEECYEGPWDEFMATGNPEPMIKALRGTLKMLEGKAKRGGRNERVFQKLGEVFYSRFLDAIRNHWVLIKACVGRFAYRL